MISENVRIRQILSNFALLEFNQNLKDAWNTALVKKFWIGLFFLSYLQTPAFAVDPSGANFAATKRLYVELLSSPAPDVASLKLFVDQLPKGADLHHHFSGAIYVENYLDLAKKMGFCIYNKTDTDLRIKKYHVETNPAAMSAAKSEACLSVDEVHKDNLFYRGLLMSWSSKDYSNHFHDESPPDKHFFDTFGYFESLAPYGYADGLKQLKTRAKAEGVGYIETMLKSSPSVDSPELANIFKPLTASHATAQDQTVFEEAYQYLLHDSTTAQKIKEYISLIESASEGVDDEHFRIRMLAYVSRNSEPNVFFGRLYTAFAAAMGSSRIVGVNVVGPENMRVAMRDYDLHMKMFAFLSNRFPKVKIAMHAGELVLGMVPPEGLRTHISQAVMVAGASRIGHGVDMPFETNAVEVLKYMAQNKIALEVNLTSNKYILGVTGADHPLSLYKRFSVPYVISTDDPGVSRNNLSGEYLLYITNFRPSYEELKTTVYNSIRYSFLRDDEKLVELKKLNKKFANFESSMAAIPQDRRRLIHGDKVRK